MQVHEGLSRERSISTPSKHVNGRNHLLHAPGGSTPRHGKQDAADLVSKRLKEALANASERGVDYVKLDRGFVDAILMAVDQKKEQVHELSGKLDGLKRTSKQIMDGMSVAQEEYDKELSARRTAEAEVSRLRVELSGQTARLTAMSGDDRRRELQQQMTKELSDNLGDLERDVSKLRVERDMTLAEVEELSASKRLANVLKITVSSNLSLSSSPIATEAPAANLSRSLTMRLDNIKRQYQKDLIPLTQQREVLMREILELKEARDIFLEETTVLNARNEELAELNAQYERRLDLLQPTDRKVTPPQNVTPPKSMDTSKSRQGGVLAPAISTTSTTSSGTLIEDNLDLRPPVKQQKSDSSDSAGQQRPRGIGIRWMGNKANKELSPLPQIFDIQKPKSRVEHAFQQLSVLRFARCDHCGDKMWGSQLRCSTCNIAVHVRCVNNVQASCAHESSSTSREESSAPAAPLPPSMFGRNLIEQVLADSATKGGLRTVPVIVEKCIDAVEALGMDYEGIYRKTGGSGQSKSITQLFERGDYDSFDLRDSDLFNDISSVTSVLKNYFRALPDPLLTYSLHEGFVSAASIREPTRKAAELTSLVAQLPKEHYHTLCHLMLHLHRVQLQSDVNRMNARNLGVVFGPTLMRSQDVAREFADMAGKALSIEWLVENAPVVFSNTIPQS
ncbi:RhoGAP-domain-containing protein [Rickenella mellea]|uniref:RhoGAP-domain-containing protein n=1 Tax=Rickenella mellea TaxID=50990 RepID=A0A4Y7QF09_9AGAM|nr:RhoGAP-domain-containing protein [Rickenella mellea]